MYRRKMNDKEFRIKRFCKGSCLKNHMSRYLRLMREKNISFIFPSSNIEGSRWTLIAYLNQAFHLHGINKKQADFWRFKTSYLQYFKKLGFKVPSLYQTLSPGEKPDLSSILSFPVICKPDSGSGGSGVFLASSPDVLRWFFRPDPCQNLNRFEKYWRVQFKNKKYANYIYQNFSSKYIVEKFIPGLLLSVAGIKAVNGIEISIVFEIGLSSPPFRSESEFLAPFSEDEKSVEKVYSFILRLVKESVFSYGPFMLDFIIGPKGEFYLIDAAPRISATAGTFFKPCYNDIYYERRAVRAFLGQPIDIQERGEPVNYLYLRRLPLPKGRFIRFFQKEPFSDYVVVWRFNLKPGDLINEGQNDLLQVRKGELAVRGASMREARNQWFKEFQKLEFTVEEDKSPVF